MVHYLLVRKLVIILINMTWSNYLVMSIGPNHFVQNNKVDFFYTCHFGYFLIRKHNKKTNVNCNSAMWLLLCIMRVLDANMCDFVDFWFTSCKSLTMSIGHRLLTSRGGSQLELLTPTKQLQMLLLQGFDMLKMFFTCKSIVSKSKHVFLYLEIVLMVVFC